MPCILFAWEMGANWGHIARDLPLARRCRDAGFDVVMAVPNLRTGVSLLRKEGFTLVAAPALRSLIKRTAPPINYADMLMHEGWDDVDSLDGAVTAWQSLIRLSKARAVVFNHAPTVLVAARLEKIPVLLVGTGFELPPPQTPLPSFRPWQKIPAEHFHDAEYQLLQQINAVLARQESPALGCVAELFASSPIQLATLPELDPFGPRAGASYIGPVYAMADTPPVSWRTTEREHGIKHRVIIYLRPNSPQCEQVLEALQSSADIEVIGVVPGAPPQWRTRYSRLSLHDQAIELNALLPLADLVITYGPGTLATALMAGVPVLLLPNVLEQFLSGMKLDQTGAGIVYTQNNATASLDFVIRKMLKETSYRRAARQLAAKYNDLRHADTSQKLFELLNNLIKGAKNH